MSRNGFSPANSRRNPAPRWSSHLRQPSRNSSDDGMHTSDSNGPDSHPLQHSFDDRSSASSTPPRARSPDTMSSNSTIREHSFAKTPPANPGHTCTVTINEAYARDEVLLNLSLFDDSIQPGQLMAIDVLPDQRANYNSLRRAAAAGRKDDLSSSVVYAGSVGTGDNASTYASSTNAGTDSASTAGQPELDSGRRYLFIVKDMSKELKLRYSTVQIFVAKRIADVFGMKKGSTVLLTHVDASNPAVEASHVELVFKDQYLSRADMWRLSVAELSERTVYRGQMVLFMSTIKATVTHVFVDGKQVQSAFFGKHTRPIFRSESARFVLFIQMAREMWDFDSDCSGEIIFSKVVNGLLPALFTKWAARKVKHLVTIVLFARVEYDTGLTVDLAEASMQHDYYTGVQSLGNRRPYKDFYRVVVSEMSSGEWTRILYQLKREFNIFRRDISLHHLSHLRPDTAASASDDPYKKPAHSQKNQHIQAESSSAMYGNVLEAIDMASTLFSQDYVDRDLMRTGISVVVITPGSGVFEVEYDALRRTTEALIGNGIGIDLICVPRVPLHYAPLFRFRHPQLLERDFLHSRSYSHTSHGTQRGSHGGLGTKPTTPIYGSYTSLGTSSLSPGRASETQRAYEAMSADRFTDTWIYALPQWLHVSYWATEPGELLTRQGVPPPPIPLEGTERGKHLEEFAVRCRMYDLQMRGVLETNEIETTPLHMDPLFPRAAFRPSSRSSAAPPASINGVLTIPNKIPSNILFDQVFGFKAFGEKLAKMDSKSIWKQLQEYDTTRQKLPTTRRGPTHAPSYRRDRDEGHSASGLSGLVSGPSTLRKQNYLGAGGPGTLDAGNQSLHADPRSSTQAGLSVRNQNAPSSQDTPGATPSSALTSSRGLAPSKGTRDANRSVSFDKVSITSSRSSSSKMPKAMRQISLGKKGFGIAAPKAMAAEVNVQAVAASGLSTTSALAASIPPKPPSTPNKQYPSMPTASSPFISDSRFSPAALPPSGYSLAERSYRQGLGGAGRSIGGGGSSTDLRRLVETPTRPIAIRGPDGISQIAAGSFLGAGLAGRAGRGADTDERDNRYANAARAEDVQRVYNSKLLAEAVPEVTKALSPIAAMAPWLMIMNPSKPEVNKMDSVTFNSRWQHVFPRPGEIRAMRWKVMIAPASVPLTTEYFPTKTQFETEFQQQPYSVSQADEDVLAEVPQTRDDLLRELISLRLTQGFQVVVGPVVAKAFGQKQMKIADIFSTEQPVEDGTSIFMSMGNTIHQLSFANTSEVQVNIYQRKTDAFNGGVRPQGDGHSGAGATSRSVAPLYRPAIRTLLDRDFETTTIDISAPRTEQNWNYIDSYLAGHGEQLTDSLRFWRARFVLIPIPTPKSASSAANNATTNAPASNPNRPGDNDEEIRIEGIRKLGQLWQKHRVIPASERNFLQTSLSARQPRRWHRDTNQNPLDVVYKTEDASLVIAAELESTLSLLDGSGSSMVPRNKSQLVTNRDQFRKSSLDLAALAEAIQQPVDQGGVRMQNRRWHLRLHYNCFIGSDMTTWLLDNVEDLESREEAEALGNLLMVSDTKESASDKSWAEPSERGGAAASGGHAHADGGASGGASMGAGGAPSGGGNNAAREPPKVQGIFVHVERRHPFRDGQYFYQISSEYARPHGGGVGSWFNTRKAAPMTPIMDAHREGSNAGGAAGHITGTAGGIGDSSRVPAPRPPSVLEDSNSSGVPLSGASTPVVSAVGAGSAGGSNGSTAAGPNNSKRPRVTLSKMMKYDVDHRKRSYRPERIDLHYDRLHNPDNCYHIRIEWMNATAKLIEDAIEVWAREAYQHGLRLVEVPIAEASAISDGNPLRRAYKVQLSRAPPTERPATYFDANSLAPQAQPGRHFYQKAILRKFGFVLDTEAASNFPPSVDVQYSWGRPSYRFTQYIHRSGIILAQIDDEGSFLLLVNRLYSNRSVAPSARDNMRNNEQSQAQGPGPGPGGLGVNINVNTNVNVNASSEVNPLQSPMVKSGLFNSPRLRPTGALDALKHNGSSSLLNKAGSAAVGPGPGTSPIVTNNGNGSLGAGGAAGSLGTIGVGSGVPGGPRPGPGQTPSSAVLFPITALGLSPGDDPESVMDDLEAFCRDGDGLEAFYAEVLEKRAAAVRAGDGITGMPGVSAADGSSATTPSSRAFGGAGANPATLSAAAARATAEVPDTNIPDFGLPPGLLNNSGLQSPRVGAGGATTLRSPPPLLHPHHSHQLLGGPSAAPTRTTTSPGFLASRLFLRRGSVDDVALQNAQQNPPSSQDAHE